MNNIQKIDVKRIVVIQSKIQFEHYKNFNRLNDDLIICIGPESMNELDKCGWLSCNLDDLSGFRNLKKEKKFIQEKLESLIDDLNFYSSNLNKIIGIEIGNYYAFQLWVIIGQIWNNYFIVSSIFNKFNPSQILCYSKANPKIFMDYRPDSDSIFSEILSSTASIDRGAIKIQLIGECRVAITFRAKVSLFLPKKIMHFIRKLNYKLRLKNFDKSEHAIALIGGIYDWGRIAKNDKFNKIFKVKILYGPTSKPKAYPGKDILEILHKSVELDGRQIYDLTYLGGIIEGDLVEFSQKASVSIKEIKKFKAVVTSCLTYPSECFLAHMAMKSEVPFIVWQHGEKGQCIDETVLSTEVLYATDYLAFAPAVTKMYQSWIGRSNLKNIATVGSISKKVKWEPKNLIVYATGKWFKTGLPNIINGDPDTHLFKGHKLILDYLDNLTINNIQVIFKANNTIGLNSIPYDLNNIRIEYKESFTSLLSSAKVVILDAPSTTLVEACSTKVPIFAIGRPIEYLPDFLSAVKKRVVWCETPNELIKKLDAFLIEGVYEADVNDQTYMNSYCSNVDEVTVCNNVIHELICATERS